MPAMPTARRQPPFPSPDEKYRSSYRCFLLCLILPMVFPRGLFRPWQAPSLARYWMNECGNARQGGAGRGTISGQPKQDQCDCGGRRLNPQYPAADGHGAVDTGDDHAEQKEHFDLEREAGVAVNQSPDEAGGEKAVVEPLVGGEYGGIRCLLERVAKGLQAQRLGPEKHLQNQKIDMQCRDQRHDDIGNPNHVAFPPKPTKRMMSPS